MNDLAQVITALFVLFFVMVIYFLPFVIANARKHASQWAIFFVNLLFGWTIFGWLICFIWAFGNPGHPQIIIYKEMK